MLCPSPQPQRNRFFWLELKFKDGCPFLSVKKSLSQAKYCDFRFRKQDFWRRIRFTFTLNALFVGTIIQTLPLIRTSSFDVALQEWCKIGKNGINGEKSSILTMFAIRFFPLISAYWCLINRILSVSINNHLNTPWWSSITFFIAFIKIKKLD